MHWQQWRTAQLPSGITILRDVHYGDGARETFDVHAPVNAHGAPVIFMVHGGAWRFGDKSARVVQNKVAHWVPRGVIVVSVDCPMLPDAPPLQQARDVGMALAAAQRDPAQWGGDPHKFLSSRRSDSCGQAQAFAAKARGLGTRVEVLPENLSH